MEDELDAKSLMRELNECSNQEFKDFCIEAIEHLDDSACRSIEIGDAISQLGETDLANIQYTDAIGFLGGEYTFLRSIIAIRHCGIRPTFSI